MKVYLVCRVYYDDWSEDNMYASKEMAQERADQLNSESPWLIGKWEAIEYEVISAE